MTKTLTWIGASILLIGLATFGTYQFNESTKKEDVIQQQFIEIAFLDESLTEETTLRMQAEEKAYNLAANLLEARDSVVFLQKDIIRLHKKIKTQDKTLRSLSKKFNSIEKAYASLKEEIAILSQNEHLDKQLISQLETEKAKMRNEMKSISMVKEQEEIAQQEAHQDLLAKEINEAKMRRVTKIIDNTQVVYKKVSPQNKRFGKTIKKIKSNNTSWSYTIMEFQLLHDDHQLLLDEQFIAKIINSDSNEVLSYIESNPNFPESDIDTKGINFSFDGNLVEIQHFNNANKTGENYEIRLYYIDSDGKEHLLRGGVKKFMQNRKLVK